jgi:hypothetical protein
MNGKTVHKRRVHAAAPDADIDQFLAEHHDDVAAQLAAGRDQVARGEAVPLEPLDVLLRDARARR